MFDHVGHFEDTHQKCLLATKGGGTLSRVLRHGEQGHLAKGTKPTEVLNKEAYESIDSSGISNKKLAVECIRRLLYSE